MHHLLKKIFYKFYYLYRAARIELNVSFNIPYNYCGNKILLSKESYLKLYSKAKNLKSEVVDKIENELGYKLDQNWMHSLALITQVVKKESEINYLHGRLLYSYLMKFLENKKNICVLETGTSRGFSSICMSKAIIDSKASGKIITIDVMPHNYSMYWNCISDHEGKKTREQLLNQYNSFLQNIVFLHGKTKRELKKLNLSRIHFCFLDAVHKYNDLKFELDFVKIKQQKGDIIFFDDVTENKFDGVVKLIEEFKEKNQYAVKQIRINDQRGYAVAIKR